MNIEIVQICDITLAVKFALKKKLKSNIFLFNMKEILDFYSLKIK